MNIRKIFGLGLIVIVLATAGYALAETESEIDEKMQAARMALNRAEYEKAAELMRVLSIQQEYKIGRAHV